MDHRLKRILLILGFTLAVVLFAVAIVLFLFRPPSLTPEAPPIIEPEVPIGGGTLPPAQPGTPGSGAGEEPPSGPGTLPPSAVAEGGETFTTQLTTGAIIAPMLNGNEVAYYDPTDGRFYTIDDDANVSALTSTQFLNASNVVIAPNSQAAAIEFPDGSNILFDFNTETQVTLPNHWEDFGFTSDAQRVATKSIGIDANNRSLIVTNTDGSQTTAIAALGGNADAVTINWSPNNQIVGFANTSNSVQSAFGRRQMFLIGADGSERGALTVEGGNFSAQWSPDGANVLYSVANAAANNRPALWYANASGQTGSARKKLPVETWVEKCTFVDAATVYCAVPRIVTNESGYDHNLITSPDDVYAIDLASGRASLLAIPVLNLQMENLSVSSNRGTLFFTDQFGRLNSIRLR